nr:putative reverse transcriptase domain-containing protein [Tanacetum cinerariifolium]
MLGSGWGVAVAENGAEKVRKTWVLNWAGTLCIAQCFERCSDRDGTLLGRLHIRYGVRYHPEEENIITNALSRKERSKQEHEQHLKLILELLKKEQLYAKFSKCEFWIPKLHFLGHVIDSQGIHVDPTKIESIKEWSSPKTATKIRQVFRSCRLFRRFIEGFSKIAKSMTKLTQKKVKLKKNSTRSTQISKIYDLMGEIIPCSDLSSRNVPASSAKCPGLRDNNAADPIKSKIPPILRLNIVLDVLKGSHVNITPFI